MNGTSISKKFLSIANNNTTTQPILVNSNLGDCCFELPVLAEIGTNTSDLRNDKASSIFFLDNFFTSAVMVLLKDNIQVATLNNNTLGAFFAYGYGGTTKYNEKRIGYLLDFNKIITIHGPGDYQLKCTATTILATTIDYFSLTYCLSEYAENKADNTVRLDFYKNGNEGSTISDNKKFDFAELNWYNSIRIPNANFGQTTSEKTKNFVKYQNGSQVWIEDSLDFEYTLQVTQVPFWLVELINNYNTNSEMYVTDYNLINSNSFNKKAITSTSGFIPTYTEGSIYLDSTFSYKPLINNYLHKRD